MNQALENLSKKQLISLLKERETQISSQEVQISNQEVQVAKYENEVVNLKSLVDKLNRMLFGSKKEKFIKEPVDSSQLSLSFEELAQKDPYSNRKTGKGNDYL
jgi:hypothetical protein